jgi:hypothetical protein
MTVDGVEVEPDKAESTPFFHASRTLQLAKNIPNQASAQKDVYFRPLIGLQTGRR